MPYEFRPGCPWHDDNYIVHRAKCPVHVYGPGVDRGFVVDAVYEGPPTNRTLRKAYEIASTIARALTLAAADPDFDMRYLLSVHGISHVEYNRRRREKYELEKRGRGNQPDPTKVSPIKSV